MKYRIWYKFGDYQNCKNCSESQLYTGWYFRDVNTVKEIKEFFSKDGIFFDPSDYVVTGPPIYNFKELEKLENLSFNSCEATERTK